MKKNDTKPNPEMVSMERCLIRFKVTATTTTGTTTATTTTHGNGAIADECCVGV